VPLGLNNIVNFCLLQLLGLSNKIVVMCTCVVATEVMCLIFEIHVNIEDEIFVPWIPKHKSTPKLTLPCSALVCTTDVTFSPTLAFKLMGC
jgi:hypothetical protein